MLQDMSRQIELSIGPDLQYIQYQLHPLWGGLGFAVLVSHVGEITLFLK